MSELLGADTDALDRGAESLSADARRIQDIRILAQRAVAELQASWTGADQIHLARQWEQQASPMLAGACASLDTCATQLRAQSAAQRVASSNDGGVGPPRATAVTALITPPMHGSPSDNASWWRSLSPGQQQEMTQEHPDWIGHLDGVSFTARDLANRALLGVDRDLLVAERERLEAALAPSWSGEPITDDDPATLLQVKEKLASLDMIVATLALPGERQLLLLDMTQERAQAAVANGNVETADNVAVVVPGMSTTVSQSLQGWDIEMRHLQERAQLESQGVTPFVTATTATVTWIGYQAPMRALDLANPEKSALFIPMAKKGAAQLAPFLRGIGASREHAAHLTLLGHSDGSTTAGLALRRDTGVNDAVFFGSPGLSTNQVQDLKLAPGQDPAGNHDTAQTATGHIYYVEARQDLIGDLGTLGADPSHMDGIRHLSARESTVTDPVTHQVRQLKEVTGHGSYLAEGSTSQYNVSVIVAGVPDRRVYDAGEDLGDLLSMPLPSGFPGPAFGWQGTPFLMGAK